MRLHIYIVLLSALVAFPATTSAQLQKNNNDNAMKYVLHRPLVEPLRFDRAAGEVKPLFLHFSGGADALVRANVGFSESVNYNIRVGAGMWFTPVSGLEVGFTYATQSVSRFLQGSQTFDRISRCLPDKSVDVSYLFNIVNFTTHSNDFHRFGLVGRVGAMCLFASKSNTPTYGGVAALRFEYHPDRAITFYAEPKFAFYGTTFSGTLVGGRGYVMQPGVSLGANLTLNRQYHTTPRVQYVPREKPSYDKKRLSTEWFVNMSYGIEGILRGGAQFSQTLAFTARAAVGSWLTPVSGVEVGISGYKLPTSYLAQSGVRWAQFQRNLPSLGVDVAYLFNMTNFTYASVDPRSFDVVGTVGASYRFGNDVSSYGAFVGLRGYYHPNDIFALYVEPRFALNRNNFGSAVSGGRGYYMQPAVNLGMQLSLNNRYVSTVEGEPQAPVDVLAMVKTNLLYDVMSLVNFEVEVPFGDKTSLNAECVFPWWSSADKSYRDKIFYCGLEGRYWLGNRDGRAKLTGHYFGAYVGLGDYDIRKGGAGYDGESMFNAGVSYGYGVAIGRRFNLQFSAGAGVVTTVYNRYNLNVDDARRQSAERTTKFGLTQSKISVGYIIGSGRIRRAE